MSIIITGSSGFIGYSLAKRFLQSGFTVIGVDIMNSYYDISLKKSRLNQLKKYKAALFFDSGFDMFFVNFFTFIKCLIFKIPIVFVVTQIDTNWLNIKKNNLFYLIKAS